MAITGTASRPAFSREVLRPVAVTAALSTAVAVLALVTASGAVQVAPATYDTEYISDWWWLAWLLVPLVGVATWRHPSSWWLQVLALVLPQYVAAAICVARYRVAGWGSGLEVFALVMPVGLSVLAVAVAGLVLGVRTRRRR